MLYCFNDCGVYNSTEPTVTAWINARDVQSAVERLTALLALTWEVASDRVCLNGGRSEIEIERESVQLASAGARRWLESGSAGDDPLYHRVPTLHFLGATDLEPCAPLSLALKRTLASCIINGKGYRPRRVARERVGKLITAVGMQRIAAGLAETEP